MNGPRGIAVAGAAIACVILAVFGKQLGIQLDAQTLMAVAAVIGALTQVLGTAQPPNKRDRHDDEEAP